MTPPSDRTYGIGAFAALAGVTPRALRHYDRLGLLKPRRSRAGYRIYCERDLETLEEIVALRFIGVPLKEITAVRRRATGPFVEVLRAQRELLESRRRRLTRAIAAIARAEAAVRSGPAVHADLIRGIIEEMQMENQHEDEMTAYAAMLRAKAMHLAGLSAEGRAELRQQWVTLIDDVRASLGDDPAGPKGQALLDRWLSLLQRLSGADAGTVAALGADSAAFHPTPQLWDELWARRAEWLPPEAARAAESTAADQARANAQARATVLAGSDVMEFIRRARAARG